MERDGIISAESLSSTDSDCAVCLEPVESHSCIEMPCCGKRACVACVGAWEAFRNSTMRNSAGGRVNPHVCIYCRTEYLEEDCIDLPDIRGVSVRGMEESEQNRLEISTGYICCLVGTCLVIFIKASMLVAYF